MKILHLSPNEYPNIDTNHPTKLIWKELSKNVSEYHLLARKAKGAKSYSSEGNIFLHLLPPFLKSRSYFFTSIILFYIVKRYKIDVIVSQCPIRGGFFAVIAKLLFKVPVLIEIHGMEYFRILKSKKLHLFPLKIVLLFALKNSTKVRSLSSSMTLMLKEYHVQSNVVEIPNRVNLNIFDSPKVEFKLNKPIKVVSVGRFVWEKGYNYLIEAIILLQSNLNIELTLIGGGPLLDSYINLINKSQNIHFINQLTQTELKNVINSADIYVQSSVSEGMPRTLLEAMALKLPIITTNVGAIPGIMIHKYNCIMIEPSDVTQLVESIRYLTENQDLRIILANNAYQDAQKKYEWNLVFNKYRQEIESMSKKKI